MLDKITDFDSDSHSICYKKNTYYEITFCMEVHYTPKCKNQIYTITLHCTL